jgi:C1A family cysteine protease
MAGQVLFRLRCWAVSLIAAVAVLCLASQALAQLTPEDIDRLRKQGEQEGWTFTVGESPATRRPMSELCGAVEPPDWWVNAPSDPCRPVRGLPDYFDWRDYGACTPIRDQDGCGSCWAFGAIGSIECKILIVDGVSEDLSEQWLVSCTSAGSCGGGWHTESYEFLRCDGLTDPCGDFGAVLEGDFPYVAWDAPCGCPYPHPYCIDSWAFVEPAWDIPAVEQIKQAIYERGPVSTCVYVNSAFAAYTGGVFNACQDEWINHVVVLVGWDDNQGPNGVWFLRNSWGPGWGESGYMRIVYECSRIGYATCYVDYAGKPLIGFEYPEGLPQLLTPNAPTTVRVNVVPTGGTPVPGSGTVTYRVDGGSFQSEAMSETNPNEYEAPLPAVECESLVEYYFSAEEKGGNTYTDPRSAPESLFSAAAAYGIIEVFADDFNADQGWMVENSGGLTDGAWQRAIPAGGGDRGDPPSDYDGSGWCYVTDNADGNSDVDDGYTWLISPTIDVSDADAIVHYALWYTNNYGNDPNNDLFKTFVSNDDGDNWVLAETIGPQTPGGGWNEHSFRVGDFVTPTSQVTVRFEASDLNDGSVVEAGIDDFLVFAYDCTPPCPGDLDGDGDTDQTDLGVLLASFGADDGGDLDGDGDTDQSDLGILLADWGCGS